MAELHGTRMNRPTRSPLCVIVCLVLGIVTTSAQQQQGTWSLMTRNAGIASMHTAIGRYGHAILLDRMNAGPTQIDLKSSECAGRGGNETSDCTAHSVMFIPEGLALRPLTLLTDTWRSSGQFAPNGTLIQTGGAADGSRKVRYLTPCPPGGECDWTESDSPALQADRWYATNQILPDGRQIIIGGYRQPSVEFLPDNGEGVVFFPFLAQNGEDDLYPYVHLLPDGNLFVFMNRASIIYDYTSNTVVKTLPNISADTSGGSSVMLPLTVGTNFAVAEILVCGGSDSRAFKNASGQFPSSQMCGRIRVSDAQPSWTMETMPFGRCMGDMVLLPSGSVLIINGAQAGAPGFRNAFQPALSPVLYEPNAPQGVRFMTLKPSTVPRMYHSTANLLPDGRVMVAGSNPQERYTFLVGEPVQGGNYPTDLSVEAFSPPYLSSSLAVLKPTFLQVPLNLTYGKSFIVSVQVPVPVVGKIFLTLVSAPYTTHSFSQGQRLLALGGTSPISLGDNRYQVAALAPPNASVAPPSYYMLFAINQGVPSVGAWVRLS